ncbi:MAG: hypothetical protein ACREL7_16075 [Longimicrobiales bacterium]
MGLTWAVAWGFVGFLMEFVDPHGQIADIWPALFAIPAFLGGVIFSVVLGIAERRRRFDELSIPRFGAWGAVAGLLVGALPFVLGSNSSDFPTWQLALMIMAPISVLSGVSAAGSLAIARKAEQRESLDARPHIAELAGDMRCEANPARASIRSAAHPPGSRPVPCERGNSLPQ